MILMTQPLPIKIYPVISHLLFNEVAGTAYMYFLCAYKFQNLLYILFQMVSLGFFMDIKSFRSHYGPGVDSACNRNEYQEYFLGGKKRLVRKADILNAILGHCHVIWEP